MRAHQGNFAEIAAGHDVRKNATSACVKHVGAVLVRDHTKLDTDVKRLADKLDVTLPTSPSAEQNKELAAVQAKTGGPAYDAAWLTTQDAAHRKTLTLKRPSRCALGRAGGGPVLSWLSGGHLGASRAISRARKNVTAVRGTGAVVPAGALPEPALIPGHRPCRPFPLFPAQAGDMGESGPHRKAGARPRRNRMPGVCRRSQRGGVGGTASGTARSALAASARAAAAASAA